MPKDIKLVTEGFNIEILCFYKEYNKGYDIYISGKCTGSGLTSNELEQLEQLERILKCSCKELLDN